MRILLLGKHGQVGAELLPQLVNKCDLIAPDRAELDLANADALREMLYRIRPQLIVNAAAYTAVDRAESDLENALAVNRDAPAMMAVFLAEVGGALLHFSTDYVFDGRKAEPYSETDATGPINAYGVTKLAGEKAIAASGCAHIIIRTSWVYGVHGDNFCRLIGRLARTREILEVVADQTGSPTSARSLAHAAIRLIDHHGDGLFRQKSLIHIAGAGATTRFTLAEQVLQALTQRFGSNIKAHRILPVTTDRFPAPALRPVNSALAINRYCEISGARLPPWQDDIAAFVATSPAAIWS